MACDRLQPVISNRNQHTPQLELISEFEFGYVPSIIFRSLQPIGIETFAPSRI